MKFSNDEKLRHQMRQRGWTEQLILEAMQTQGIPTKGRNGSATRYVHPITRKSVVVDDASGEVFHVGGKGFKYD
jgi:hypothetical protein